MLHPVYDAGVSASEKRATWIKLIEEYKKSDLTQAAFVAAHGLKARDLSRWHYRLNQEKNKDKQDNKAKFIPVTLTTDANASVELYHASGFRLMITLESDETVLKKAVKLLSGLTP